MKLSAVIGSPVAHSLSPAMHNAAYRALKIDSVYHFTAEKVEPEGLEVFINRARRDYHALAVTVPHKETILPCLDRLDAEAQAIGAVNTILIDNGTLTGYNTDSPGAIQVLKEHTSLKRCRVAVLGTGGTARAIIYGLMKEGAEAMVFGRNRENLKALESRFGCKALQWDEITIAPQAGIIINTTPIGREGEASPLPVNGIGSSHIVFDVNYNLSGIPLLKDAGKKGATVIDGLELLLHQGALQFKLMTGLDAPVKVMREALKAAKENDKKQEKN